jgi:hypothetical protein
MDPGRLVAYVALAWLLVGTVLMGRSIRKGRELAAALAERHPATYEALGRPRPGWFHGVRRDRFARFVGRGAFRALDDPALVSRFEDYRRSDARLVVALLASMVVVGLLVLAVRFLG